MGKIRVYELAKDLNMTNTAFLNKMKELKIEVKSHMSSLEDSDISAIKRSLFGKEKTKNDVIVKPSVIRRRRLPSEEITMLEVDEEITATDEEPEPEIDQKIQDEKPKALEIIQSEKNAESELKKDKSMIKKAQPARIIKPAVIKSPVDTDLRKIIKPISAPELKPESTTASKSSSKSEEAKKKQNRKKIRIRLKKRADILKKRQSRLFSMMRIFQEINLKLLWKKRLP